ncbi:hypothetical protein [Enterobacter chuandaensis]|uniref:hypothetical protein n=1 Tax=Enterobacter chuandaensis TaxID=2497875 RepID=UPI001C2EF3CC|nr:hypothetical protein [Enterobacter chuandaensis]
MKRTMSKNLATLLILAATGLPLAAQAAGPVVTIPINATLEEVFTIDDIGAVTFDDTLTAKDVNITVKSNVESSQSKAVVEVYADEADKDTDGFTLKQTDGEKNGLMKIAATLDGTAFQDGRAVASDVMVANPVKLHLIPNLTATSEAGNYQGHLTVKVTKA